MSIRIVTIVSSAILALATPAVLAPGAFATATYPSHAAQLDTFAGYTATIAEQGKSAKSYLSGQTYFDPMGCGSMSDGATWTTWYNVLNDAGQVLANVTTTHRCYGGQDLYIIKTCWVGRKFCILFSKGYVVVPGWQAWRVAPTKNGNGTVVTVSDPMTGKSMSKKFKGAVDVASVAVGFSATDEAGNPIPVGPFPSLQFSNVTVGDQPIALARPVPVTFHQDGVAVAAPSAIGDDKESFAVTYLGP